ncbi:Uncharacterised protein [Mycobacteroides abscessus subsp. bolletii]|nr:Uncharacterised protein [Mycobacteroides abscessus subsp. bolletii]
MSNGASRLRRQPKGPNGTYIQGQRVPFDHEWVNQLGQRCWLEAHGCFPPPIGWVAVKGLIAYWWPYDGAAPTAS